MQGYIVPSALLRNVIQLLRCGICHSSHYICHLFKCRVGDCCVVVYLYSQSLTHGSFKPVDARLCHYLTILLSCGCFSNIGLRYYYYLFFHRVYSENAKVPELTCFVHPCEKQIYAGGFFRTGAFVVGLENVIFFQKIIRHSTNQRQSQQKRNKIHQGNRCLRSLFCFFSCHFSFSLIIISVFFAKLLNL